MEERSGAKQGEKWSRASESERARMAKEILDTHGSERKATKAAARQAGTIKGTTGEGEKVWPHGMVVDTACMGRHDNITVLSFIPAPRELASLFGERPSE